MQEEIFGPVVAITTFETEAEAITLCNSIQYGLAASIWSGDAKKCHRVAQAVESGVVWVNCWMIRDLRTPFGGMKRSGLGREGGDYSIDSFTEQKAITMQIS
jgi:aminomuconate-semialdehyde/2-hydroxymuconate-6-semialdehyde dehydrogenase